jgi:hypothetical protein
VRPDLDRGLAAQVAGDELLDDLEVLDVSLLKRV